MTHRKGRLVLLALAAASVVLAADNKGNQGSGNDTPPMGRGEKEIFSHKDAGPPAGAGPSNNITYHGGPVMHGPVNAYVIWYGNWAGNTATTILSNFLSNIGGSPYFNINKTYSDGSGAVSGAVTLAGQAFDNYSQGTALSDAGVQAVVTSAIGSSLPSDANGVYFVLTSADVNETSGFCTKYCGWHTYANISGTAIKYSFVGNPDRCPTACQAQSIGPNGNAGADGMASIIAHELEEAVTDPQLNAWYDKRGQENADKCAWTFGSTSTAPNGAAYNVTLGGAKYLIQQNWSAATQKCGMQ